MLEIYVRLLFILAMVLGKNYVNRRCPLTNAVCDCMGSESYTELNFYCPKLYNHTVNLLLKDDDLKVQCTQNPAEIPDLSVQNTSRVLILDCRYLDNMEHIFKKLHLENVETFQFQSCMKSYSCISIDFTLKKSHLKGLQSLSLLYLDNNSIDDLEDGVFEELVNLRTLDMSKNNLTEITGSLSGLSNLEKLDLSRNAITTISDFAFKDLTQLKVLHLWKNNLSALTNKTFASLNNLNELELLWNKIESLPRDIFKPLANLQHVSVASNRLLEIPSDIFSNNIRLENVTLRYNLLRTLHVDTFANVHNLLGIDLRYNKLTHLPNGLFNNLTKLRVLRLDNNDLEILPKNLFDSLTNLLILNLRKNKISTIPPSLFTNLIKLTNLDLGLNSLTVLDVHSFGSLTNLEILILERNNISVISSAFDRLGKLKELNLAFNKLLFKDQYPPLNKLLRLEKLDLSHNNLQAIEDDFILVKPNIKELNLSYNNITNFFLLQVKSNAEINLMHNKISYIDFAETLFNIQSIRNEQSTVRIKISNNPIRCDCYAFYLIKYINDNIDRDLQQLFRIIDTSDLKCASPENFVGRSVNSLKTQELTCDSGDRYKCPKDCRCDISPHNRSLIIDCSNRGLKTVPAITPFKSFFFENMITINQTELHLENNSLTSVDYVNFTRVHLENNRISNISNISSSVQCLYLHNNKLQKLNSVVLSELVASKSLSQLSLHNNPWICKCQTSNFSRILREKLVKKLVRGNITCQESGYNIIDLTTADLCTTHTGIIIGLGAGLLVFLLFIAISMALFYRYEHEVKVWLFSHEMFLWFVTEDELDKDKVYDAFVCFSHKDEDFIIKHLVPGLEEVQNPYKLCIHERDWMPGEYITTQVVQSVNDSRRTIVVLSPNFLESEWARMEFRTAHSQAMNEGRSRVIVILYGEVDHKKLDDEMKTYLKTNTYLKWGDPWFWKKLRFAMPHTNKYVRKSQNQKMENIMVNIDKLDLINSPSTPNVGTPPAISGDPLLLKSHPLSFKMNKSDVVTPPAESGLVVTHNC